MASAVIYHNDPYVHYEDMDIAHMQIVYLHHVQEETASTISGITGYAVSTVRNYWKKFIGLLDKAKAFFGKGFTTYKFHLPTFNLPEKFNVDAASFAYVIELTNEEDEVVYLKVGKTNNVCKRMRALQRDYRLQAQVKMLFPCDSEDDALSMENILRKTYKKECPDKFIRQDRFFAVTFNKDFILNSPKVIAQYQLLDKNESDIIY